MKIAELTNSQARIMLADDPCRVPGAEDVKNLSLTGKYGWPVSDLAADAASRDGAVLVIDLAGDDDEALINAAAAEAAPDKIVSAASAIAAYIHAQKILIAAPEGISLPMENAEVIRVDSTPVLRELSALYHILETGELRSGPMMLDFPSQGYKGLPTVPVDAETLLKLYAMTQPGYEETKLIRLRAGSEDVLVEAKTGVSVGTLLDELGIQTAKPILIGGMTGYFSASPAGEVIRFAEQFDSVNVYGEHDCMACESARILTRAQNASCNKCVLCREGTWHLAGIFESITQGKAKKDALEMVLDIGPLIRVGAFCSFGRGMAGTAVSAVECCRAELEAHIVRKKCPAGVCAAFNKKTYCIDPTLCTGCGDCEDACDEMAIEGKKKFIYMIDPDMCTGCGKCASECEENAIVVNDGSIKLPKKLTKVGKFK